jgi:glycerol-3-phosphate cytidylyltransferase
MPTVITYGTFDLLHVGHVRLLQRAKALGDHLIVGLSTDEFNAMKHKSSFLPYGQRKEILESIRYVDLVIPETCWEQKVSDVREYKADIFVIGDDWAGEFDFLKDYCEVVYLPRTLDISSSSLKGQLKNGG